LAPIIGRPIIGQCVIGASLLRITTPARTQVFASSVLVVTKLQVPEFGLIRSYTKILHYDFVNIKVSIRCRLQSKVLTLACCMMLT